APSGNPTAPSPGRSAPSANPTAPSPGNSAPSANPTAPSPGRSALSFQKDLCRPKLWVTTKSVIFIPDFSRWKDHDSYSQAFERLVRDLKTDKEASAEP